MIISIFSSTALSFPNPLFVILVFFLSFDCFFCFHLFIFSLSFSICHSLSFSNKNLTSKGQTHELEVYIKQTTFWSFHKTKRFKTYDIVTICFLNGQRYDIVVSLFQSSRRPTGSWARVVHQLQHYWIYTPPTPISYPHNTYKIYSVGLMENGCIQYTSFTQLHSRSHKYAGCRSLNPFLKPALLI